MQLEQLMIPTESGQQTTEEAGEKDMTALANIHAKNAVRLAMKGGRPAMCPAAVSAASGNSRCGDHPGFELFREVRSGGGELMGWQCHVLGKCDHWLPWKEIKVGQVLEFVRLPGDGSAVHQIEVAKIVTEEGKRTRIYVTPKNFRFGHGFSEGATGWRLESSLRRDWRLIVQPKKQAQSA